MSMHTVQKSALNLRHVYAQGVEICLESEARFSEVGIISPESEARFSEVGIVPPKSEACFSDAGMISPRSGADK